MIEVSSRKASDAAGRLARLLSDRHIRVAAAVLMLAGGFTISHSAYAQDAESCVAKCKADEKECIHNGSSQELCEYDSKACQKACSGNK